MIKSGSFYFSKSHEWVSKGSNNKYRIGISDFAQSELGDVVYVSLPEVGKTYKKEQKACPGLLPADTEYKEYKIPTSI